jgi:hypothetical protein
MTGPAALTVELGARTQYLMMLTSVASFPRFQPLRGTAARAFFLAKADSPISTK